MSVEENIGILSDLYETIRELQISLSEIDLSYDEQLEEIKARVLEDKKAVDGIIRAIRTFQDKE